MAKKGSYEERVARFNAIKQLKKVGLSDAAVAKALGIGNSTVGLQNRHETYEEYLQWARDNQERSKNKKVDETSQTTVKMTLPADSIDLKVLDDLLKLLNNMNERMQEILELSQSIEQKTSFIERHTEVKPTKSWFAR